MDEYLFRQFVDECREVSEATSYVEILNYSVSGRAGRIHHTRWKMRAANLFDCRMRRLIRVRSMR